MCQWTTKIIVTLRFWPGLFPDYSLCPLPFPTSCLLPIMTELCLPLPLALDDQTLPALTYCLLPVTTKLCLPWPSAWRPFLQPTPTVPHQVSSAIAIVDSVEGCDMGAILQWCPNSCMKVKGWKPRSLLDSSPQYNPMPNLIQPADSPHHQVGLVTSVFLFFFI